MVLIKYEQIYTNISHDSSHNSNDNHKTNATTNQNDTDNDNDNTNDPRRNDHRRMYWSHDKSHLSSLGYDHFAELLYEFLKNATIEVVDSTNQKERLHQVQ